MQHFVIWSAGYNCAQYIKQHMESINNQSYTNYTVIIVDDASTDNTWEEIRKYMLDGNVYALYRNDVNMKNASNIANILKPYIKDDDVVINLDLDDWFENNSVLERLNEIYTSEGCWTTYGHYKHLRANIPAEGYPDDVIKTRSFREAHLYWHHLRTWKGFLLKNIDNDDLKGPDGNYVPNTWDLAVGFPILEMTPPEKLRYIPEILMVYNALNPLRIPSGARGNLREWFRGKKKYDILDRG